MLLSPLSLSLTLHELLPLLWAGAGDVQVELVDGDAVGDGQVVDALVRRLARQQLPQHHAVAGTKEKKGEKGTYYKMRVVSVEDTTPIQYV